MGFHLFECSHGGDNIIVADLDSAKVLVDAAQKIYRGSQ